MLIIIMALGGLLWFNYLGFIRMNTIFSPVYKLLGKDPQTSEEQYEEILNEFIHAEVQNCELDKEYLKKYQAVLTNKKIYMVLRAEIKFNRNMLKIIQTSKQK